MSLMHVIKFILYIVICYLLSSSSSAIAQWTWAHTYGGSQTDPLHSLDVTADGGYIIAGTTLSFGSGSEDILVIRLNSAGAMIWQNTYGGEGIEYVPRLKQTMDGGYILAGSTGSFNLYYMGPWVLKLNAFGEIQWQKAYSIPDGGMSYAVQQTDDAGYIIAGRRSFPGNGDYEFWLLKLDSHGNVSWSKSIGGIGLDEAYSIQQTSDGGYIVAGRSDSVTAYSVYFWVIKFDSSGTVIWQKAYGKNNEESFPKSIKQTNDNGFIVVGSNKPMGSGYRKMWILKLDASGNIQWQETVGGTAESNASSVLQTGDNGYIVAGYAYFPGPIWNALSLIKLDSNGGIVWQKAYSGSIGYGANTLEATPDGGYALAGTKHSSTNYDDFILIKVDSSGNMDSSCSSIMDTNLSANITAISAIDTTAVADSVPVTVSNTTISARPSTAIDTMICQPANVPVLLPLKPIIDDSSSSTPNGCIEPDEEVKLIGSLQNTSPVTATSVSGLLSTTSPITITNNHATYPDIAPNSNQSATVPYRIIAPSANRPAHHWDIAVTERPNCSNYYPNFYDSIYHIGNSFADVDPLSMFYPAIESIFHAGFIAGCDAANFCPTNNITREQIAKLLCLAMDKKTYNVCQLRACEGIFGDVPMANNFCSYIEALYNVGIVNGCQTQGFLYCPENFVQRQAMAKFICTSLEASTPGSCPTAPCTGIFNDVPSANPFCPYIEALYASNITSGCQSSPLLFCPDDNLTRAQFAKILLKSGTGIHKFTNL